MKVTINPVGELDAIQFTGNNIQEVVDFCIPFCISVSPRYFGEKYDNPEALPNITITAEKAGNGYVPSTYWVVKLQNSFYGIYSDADFQSTFTPVP